MKAHSNSNFFFKEETYKKLWKSRFMGFIPFDCLISSKIICLNEVKIGRSFVKKKPKKQPHKTWRSAHSKNLGHHVFFLSKIVIIVGFFLSFFWQRQNLVMRTVSHLWWFLATSNETNTFFPKSWKFQCFFSTWVVFKSPESFNYIWISKKGHKLGDVLTWIDRWFFFIVMVQKIYQPISIINHKLLFFF